MRGLVLVAIGAIAIKALLSVTTTPIPQHHNIADLGRQEEQMKHGAVIVSGTVISKDYYSLQISDGSRVLMVDTKDVATNIGLINKQITVSGKWDGYQITAESISLAPTELDVESHIYKWKHLRNGNSIRYQDRDLVIEVDLSRFKNKDCLQLSADFNSDTVIGADKVPDSYCLNPLL